MSEKHKPLFSCTSCASDQSLPADELREHDDALWCSDCWNGCDMDADTGIEYTDLPEFVPEADLRIKALTDGLQAIKNHMDFTGGGRLGSAWYIANLALNKAEAIGK